MKCQKTAVATLSTKKAFDAFRLLEQLYISLEKKYNDIDKKEPAN